MADDTHPRVHGEVRVIPFECSFAEVQAGKISLLDQTTIMTVVPSFSLAWFRFAGGMLLSGESWEAAAQRELVQETGVIAHSNSAEQLLCRKLEKRQRHYPTESFTVQYRMVFNCRFDTMFQHGRTGDEGEMPVEVPFWEILENVGWQIPDDSERTAYFYRAHLEVLQRIVAEVQGG